MNISTFGTQKQAQIIENVAAKQPVIMHYDVEYDETKPEDTLRNFIGSVKNMLTRYEYDKDRIVAIEAELNDIYHYVEISSYKKVPDGYKIYRKIAELRRERRACKNEIDLLWPVYQHFHATEVLNKLSIVQGECSKTKEAIDGRTYLVKTDTLDEWMNSPTVKEKEKEPEEEPYDFGIDEDGGVNLLAPIFPEDSLEPVDDPATLKSPGKTEKKPMSAFKQVWKAAK